MFLLRLALGGNAAFPTLSAVIFLVASQPIAFFLGLLPGKQVVVLGIQLGVFAAWLAWLSTRPAIPRWQVWLIIALDALWVAGSFQLLLAPPAAATSGRGSPPSSAAALAACKKVSRASIAASLTKGSGPRWRPFTLITAGNCGRGNPRLREKAGLGKNRR